MKTKHQRFAVIFMLTSLFFLGGAIFAIKKFSDAPTQLTKVASTNFNLSKIRRIHKKKDTKKVKKKIKRIRKKLKALKPVLSANFKGPNFGLNLDEISDISMDDDLLKGGDDLIMDENSVDSKPRIYFRPPMEFPEVAIEQNITKGLIELRMLIDKTGKVSKTEILNAEPKGIFEEVTLAMVHEWKFEPATYKGKNVAIWAKQVVRFGE